MDVRRFLKPTDNVEEMIQIGKQLWDANPEVYNERRRALLDKMLNEEMPGAPGDEKTAMLYRSIYDYWMYGNNLKEEFSLHFKDITHEEKKEYITFRSRLLYTHHANDAEYSDILIDKYKCYQKFRKEFLRDVIIIEKESDFDTFEAFAKKHSTFVVKPVALAFGWGIHKLTVSPDDDLHDVFAKILAEGDEIQKKHHIKTHTTQFVLEELIDQSDKLGCLHPASVNCVRLSTVVTDGKVHFFYPRLKVGNHGNFISNAGDDGFLVGIDAETGRLNTNAADEFGRVYERHPDTGIKFIGFQIPDWKELLELGKKIALELAPRIRYVGWDMAYTNKGWSILEGNPEGEFGAQFIYGKGLKKELESVLGWSPSVEYWWEDPIATKIA